jgi:hypothetical protein
MIAGTKAQTVIYWKTPLNYGIQFLNHTWHGSKHGIDCQKCFPNTPCVTDRFTPVSILILEFNDNALLNSCQKNSLEAYKKSGLNILASHWLGKWSHRKDRKNQRKDLNLILTNDDTAKQLFASHYFTIKKSKWSKKTERAVVLFQLYPDIQKPYDLAQGLKHLWKTTDKIIALGRLGR